MGLPTGTFTSPFAGRLRVSLTAKFSSSTYSNAGFPGSSANGDFALQGYAGPSGSPTYSQVITKVALFSAFELDYPGGNAAWPVGVIKTGETHTGSGIYSIQMGDITLTCVLTKK